MKDFFIFVAGLVVVLGIVFTGLLSADQVTEIKDGDCFIIETVEVPVWWKDQPTVTTVKEYCEVK